MIETTIAPTTAAREELVAAYDLVWHTIGFFAPRMDLNRCGVAVMTLEQAEAFARDLLTLCENARNAGNA